MIIRQIQCHIRSFKRILVLFTLFLTLAGNVYQIETTTLTESVNEIKNIIERVPTTTAHLSSTIKPPVARIDEDEIVQSYNEHTHIAQGDVEKRAFVGELLKLLHEQYGPTKDQMQSRQGQLGFGPEMMHSLLSAIGADGDMRRLIEWIRNSLNVASIPDLTTQFVVSKLGSVNCPALLKPDKEETLTPRFLLFNEHYTDVPFELSINPNAEECITHGKFDPRRKTIILIHGYLTGYTLVDGMTNIKNRLLDLNRLATEKATEKFSQAQDYHHLNGSSYVFAEDLSGKIRSHLYNIILVDWFNGANPTPRSNYIKAAVNAQMVGKLIARFLSSLVVQCATPAAHMQIIAHSLGCHVSGFTGKAMNAAGHRLGKIIHLDPVGLCFGRLFSQPRYRLNPNDALETQAVHVSLNIFDNPLDGAQSNFLVNGGRDQVGCGGQSEVKNSTTSSVSLLFDPAARFAPCSHLRALSLFEDDHSSEPGQCQLVGYRCQNYDKFLAGKCGQCDATNSQCRLMSLPPISMQFRKLTLGSKLQHLENFYYSDATTDGYNDLHTSASSMKNRTATPVGKPSAVGNGTSIPPTQTTRDPSTMANLGSPRPAKIETTSTTRMYGAPSYLLRNNNHDLTARSDRVLLPDKRERIAHVVAKLRAGGWTNLRSSADAHSSSPSDDQDDTDGQASEHEPVVVATATSTTTTTTAAPTSKKLQASNELPNDNLAPEDDASSRLQGDFLDQAPLGSQKLPSGSLNMPQYYLGTGALAPYCVNYYQFRVLISDSRLQRILKSNGLGSNKLLPQLSQHRGGMIAAASTMQQRVVKADGRDMLHLTVKLTDARGRFFKGFSMLENAREVTRVRNDFAAAPLPSIASPFGSVLGPNEPMIELTMLLNTTQLEPQRIGETIISYYFHQVVLADRVEINYMSNISPEVRAKYSSVLCPVAINDRHQLVRYVECRRIASRK